MGGQVAMGLLSPTWPTDTFPVTFLSQSRTHHERVPGTWALSPLVGTPWWVWGETVENSKKSWIPKILEHLQRHGNKINDCVRGQTTPTVTATHQSSLDGWSLMLLIRAIVNKKQRETSGLFMSLAIHYWIGDVQGSQGVSISENANYNF